MCKGYNTTYLPTGPTSSNYGYEEFMKPISASSAPSNPGLDALLNIGSNPTMQSVNKCSQVSKLLQAIYETEVQRIDIEKQRLKTELDILETYKRGQMQGRSFGGNAFGHI